MVARIYANLGRLLGGKAAAGVISLGYLALASRTLGATDYGVLMLVHGYAMTVGGLASLPGWHAAIRYGAQALAAGDQPRLVRLLRLLSLIETAGGAAGIVAAAVLAPMIGMRLGWSPVAVGFALPYSLAVLALMRMTPTGYLQLSGRVDLISFHYLVAPLVRLAGTSIAVGLHAGLKGFLVVWLVAVLGEWIVMWALALMVARRRLPGARLFGPIQGAVAENPGFWRFLLAAKTDVTLSEAPSRLVLLAIGWVLGPAAAGFYSIAQRVTVVFAQPAHILGQAAYSEMSRLAAEGGRGAPLRKALIHCVAIAAGAALPVLLLIVLFAPRIAVLVGGESFKAAAPIMVWLALSRTAAMLTPPVTAALTALGRPSLSVVGNLASGVSCLLVLPLMLHGLGLNGAGLNALLQAVLAAALLIWFIWRETGLAQAALTPA